MVAAARARSCLSLNRTSAMEGGGVDSSDMGLTLLTLVQVPLT